jgi:hypothetical protein
MMGWAWGGRRCATGELRPADGLRTPRRPLVSMTVSMVVARVP